MNIQQYTVEIPDAEIDSLKGRLAQTRWPDEIEGADWDYGSNLAYIRELCDYWLNEFDWREQERRINEFEHFKSRC